MRMFVGRQNFKEVGREMDECEEIYVLGKTRVLGVSWEKNTNMRFELASRWEAVSKLPPFSGGVPIPRINRFPE